MILGVELVNFSFKVSLLIFKEVFTSRMEDQEVMDQQRMLNQEEQRRILEENAQREHTRIQGMEIIQEIAGLDRERDRTTNRLGRSCNQTLSKFNLV